MATERATKGLDHQFVVGALRQTGNGDAANNACASHCKRECAAVRAIVGKGKALALEKRFSLELFLQADGVGAAVEACDGVRLSAGPLNIVWSGSVHRGVKERLSEAANVDHDGERALACEEIKLCPKLPRGAGRELWENELTFLESNVFEVFGEVHGRVLCGRWE